MTLDWFLLIYYWFLFYNLLPLSVYPCLLLHSWVPVSPGFERVFSYNVVPLDYDFPPSSCFVCIYLFINHILHFFLFAFSEFVYVDMRIYSLTERFSSTQQWPLHCPLPNHSLASTLLAGTTHLRTYNRPHSSLYKLLPGRAEFIFGIFDPWKWNWCFVPKRR
jgi:hypothetical protein